MTCNECADVIEVEVPSFTDVIEVEVPGIQGASFIDKPFDQDPLQAYLSARGTAINDHNDRNDSDH